MATKEFNTRITHKHDTEAHWALATNFSPLEGEIIIYDPDETHPTPRIKVGDGTTNVNDLLFIMNTEVDTDVESFYDTIKEAGYTGTEEEFNSSVLNLANETVVAGSIRGNSELHSDNYGAQIDLTSTQSILFKLDTHSKKYNFSSSGLIPIYTDTPFTLGSSTNPWGSIYGENIYSKDINITNGINHTTPDNYNDLVIKSTQTVGNKEFSISFNMYEEQIGFKTPSSNYPIIIKNNSIYPQYYSDSYNYNLGTTSAPWSNIYAKNINLITDDNASVAVATKTDTEAIETTLSTKSNTLTEGENIRLIPNDDGSIRVSAFEGFNTDLNELSIIAQGELSEKTQWIKLGDLEDPLNIRDFIWIKLQVPIAEQTTRLTALLDGKTFQIVNGPSTSEAKDLKMMMFYNGYGWDMIMATVKQGNEYTNAQTKMKTIISKENTVSVLEIGCLNDANKNPQYLPAGTTYLVCGRRK